VCLGQSRHRSHGGRRGVSPKSRERGQAGRLKSHDSANIAPSAVDVLMDDYLTQRIRRQSPGRRHGHGRVAGAGQTERLGRTHDEPLRIRSQAAMSVGMHHPARAMARAATRILRASAGAAWLGASDTGDLPGSNSGMSGTAPQAQYDELWAGNWRGRYPSSSVMCRTPHEFVDHFRRVRRSTETWRRRWDAAPSEANRTFFSRRK